MVDFCARAALFEIENGRYFMIENPASSKFGSQNAFSAFSQSMP